MPRRKKKPTEWTTEEAERKLFPKEVIEEVHRIVKEQDEKPPRKPSRDKSNR